MQRVLVTGCNGFIGSHLVDTLVKKNYHVFGVDLYPYQWNDNHLDVQKKDNFSEIKGDLLNTEFVRKIISDLKPDIVFHLASVVGVNLYLDDPFKVIDININTTKNLIEALKNEKCKLVFSSTSEIYGINPQIPWKEDESNRVLGSTRVDRWSYSSSKAVAEHMLWTAHRIYNLPVTVVRFFNVYGPRQRSDLVVPAMIKQALSGKPVLLYDGGRQTRCFTFVEDAVEGIILAATLPAATGHVFNIGRNVEVSIKELLQEIKTQIEPLTKINFEYVNTKKLYGHSYQDIPRRVPNVEKARDLLGWEAKTPLSEGLSRTITWWKNIYY